MKIGQVEGFTRSHGVEEQHDYVVANSVVIMNLLSKSLYSDQIKAPIRELSTNAWDSHVSAGKTTVAFDVWLPTTNEPTFRIRDYGTGLSQEAMVKLYRIYGASDKSDSNEFNGCMGIGSKSPFAYTNLFTSTSYFNGMKYVYVNSKDEYGRPKLQLMCEEPTTEPNGFEVEFSVKTGDIYTFEERAHSLYRWFPVNPNIKRGNKIRPETKNIVMKGEDWCINASSNESHAVMGYIAYPIEPKHFSSEHTVNERWYSRYSDNSPYVAMLNSGIELYFEIGDIEMDASREGLQYTKKTIDAIKAKLDEVRQEINTKVETELQTAKTLWEARCFYDKVVKSKFRSFVKILQSGKIMYQGHDVSKPIEIKDLDLLKFWYAGRYTPKRQKADGIVTDEKVRIFINDVKIGAFAAIYREMEKDDKLMPYLLTPSDPADIQTVAKAMGCDASIFVKVSSLPKPAKIKGQTQRDKVLLYKETSYRREAFKPTTVDFDDGGYYFEINNNFIRKNGKPIDIRQVNDLLNTAKALGLIDKDVDIYGVKTVVLPRYEKAAQWENIFDVLKDAIVEYIGKNNIGEQLAKLRSYDECCNSTVNALSSLNKIGHFTGEHPIAKFFKTYSDYEKISHNSRNKLDNINSCVTILGETIAFPAVESLSAMAENILQKLYPMLSVCSLWEIQSHNKVACEYVKTVDNCGK